MRPVETPFGGQMNLEIAKPQTAGNDTIFRKSRTRAKPLDMDNKEIKSYMMNNYRSLKFDDPEEKLNVV